MIDPAAVAVDESLAPDQYRYFLTRAWWKASSGTAAQRYSYLAENVSELWVPADQRRDWLLDRRVTGRRIWLQGSEKEAADAGFAVRDPWPTGRWRAPYGDFFATDAGRQPGTREDSWQVPTPDFLTALPRDPHQLHGLLQAQSPDDRPGYTGAFVYALDALRTGLVPADLRAALYRALLMIPTVRLGQVADTGGRRNLSLGIDDGVRRTEILIDSTNGQFAGERCTILTGIAGLKAGTVTTLTEVSMAVADTLGELPRSMR